MEKLRFVIIFLFLSNAYAVLLDKTQPSFKKPVKFENSIWVIEGSSSTAKLFFGDENTYFIKKDTSAISIFINGFEIMEFKKGG